MFGSSHACGSCRGVSVQDAGLEFDSNAVRVFGSKFGLTWFDLVKPSQLCQRSQSVKPESTQVNSRFSGQQHVLGSTKGSRFNVRST
ncbi:hypothetical protein Hdeb2414_s0017g00501851 [Helianthus debilis subsp. tardiflorus]